MKNKFLSKFCKVVRIVGVVGMCFLLQATCACALSLSVDFATKDKDNQEIIQQNDVVYAKEDTEEKIKKKISDTKIIDFLHLCIQANDYKIITIRNSLDPKFIEVIDTKNELEESLVYYYKVCDNAVYTIEVSDGETTLTQEVPVTIIGSLGERDTEKPIIISLDYANGNFIVETIDFKPGLYGIFEDNDSMNKIVDLSDCGNKATVIHKKESGGYWVRIYDKDDNYRECKLTGLEPRVKYCYKKDTRVKLKVLDSIGLWKITEEPDGEIIKDLQGKEMELTINVSSEDVSCIYIYNHANNYKKIELEEYLQEPEVIKAFKSEKNATLIAKDPVGLLKITETIDGDPILKLMGKNVTVRFNLSSEEISDVYVHDEFNNIAKVKLEVDENGPVVSITKDEDACIVCASDEESGIWKITEADTDRVLSNYMRQDYPEEVTEKIILDGSQKTVKVYDYAGNVTVAECK